MPKRRQEVPLKHLSPLEREWEERLRAEGLGERSLFDPHEKDQVKFVSFESLKGTDGEPLEPEALSMSIHGSQVHWSDHPPAVLFRALSSAINNLPESWPARAVAFLSHYAQSGNLSKSARESNVHVESARRFLVKFNVYAAKADLPQFPKPSETRRRAA